MVFSDYEDPEQAMKIWKNYIGEIMEQGCLREAERVLGNCVTSHDLDFMLSLLLETRQGGVIGKPAPRYIYGDSGIVREGNYPSIVREGRNHNVRCSIEK